MNRRSLVASIAIFALFASGLAAQVVDQAELNAVRDKHVRFVSYVGPHTKVETFEQIEGIGEYLGRTIAAGAVSASYFGKYGVEHITVPGAAGRLDADVFSISASAEVDDIRLLRLIVTGYLQEAYGYSFTDSDLLSEFITIYNAVYRGRLDYFQGRYSERVAGTLDPLRAGLSNLYSDWPGKTQIVIPLTAGATRGSLNTLDTGTMTDTAVVETLRGREDKGVDLRKDMVDLKERQIVEEEVKLETKKETLVAELQKIEGEKQDVTGQLKAVAQEKAQVMAKPATAETAKELTVVASKEQALEAKAGEVTAKEQTVDRQIAAVAEEEKKLDEKREQVRAERQVIAEDQKTLLPDPAVVPPGQKPYELKRNEAASAGSSRPAYFFLVIDTSGTVPSGQIVGLDAGTGAVRSRSELNSILGRSMYPFAGKVLVIAGRADRGGAVRLYELDPLTLKTVTEGVDDVFPATSVKPLEKTFLAVTLQKGTWKVGLFDEALKLLATADAPVDPYTSFSIDGDKVFFQAANGAILSVRTKDLSAEK